MNTETKPIIFCYFCGEPITKMEGCNSDSLCTHHINGNREDNRPENLVFTHCGCNSSHHNKGAKRQSRKIISTKRKAMKLFENKMFCYFCYEPITKMNGHDADSLIVHHINGDPYDDREENLAVTHKGCHQSNHISGEDNPMYGSHRSGESNPFFGEHHTEETLAKLRRPKTIEHRQNLSKSWTEERRTNLSNKQLGKNNVAKRPEVRAKITKSKIGDIPWNKNLTVKDSRVRKNIDRTTETIRKLIYEEKYDPTLNLGKYAIKGGIKK